ncbi:hypothetical protein SNE40_012062 [Patella caerulea]|uniref:Alpha-and gamma-adaptin-binding protein p34 n=1 Tax=Patella caerulea TaxID=87958 RepID=A0AAN8JQQ6_PATCE
MAAPCALFASCSEYNPSNFIKKILNVNELPASSTVAENVDAFPWKIDTKYYTATINLCTTDTRTIGDETFAESVQAFIVHFNNKEKSGLKVVDSWLPYLDQLEAQIKMLVCDTATDTHAVCRIATQKWCIEHEFEMVELEPEETSDSEDDFAETTGIKRIIQALHAHTWPNLCMKENPDVQSPYIKQLMREEAASKLSSSSEDKSDPNIPDSNAVTDSNTNTINNVSDSASSNFNNDTDQVTASGKENVKSDKKKTVRKSKEETIDSMLPSEEQAILAAIGQDHPEQESFEQLFEKLKVMKDKADSMPMGDRKVYAEKIAISFWNAIGGDDDEIAGLTDSDDDI